MAYFNLDDRWKDPGDISRPDSSKDVDLDPSDTRNDDRRGDIESYDEWLARQVKDGNYPEWFVRWAFPREQYDGTDEWKGFKNVGSFMATLFGLGAGGSLLTAGGNLLGFSKLLSSKQTASADNGNNFGNFIKNLFGSGSGSGFGSGLLDMLSGFGSQLGSSWLNYQNMEKLIDKQNAYNTPVQQMKRFEEAGLNPNLVYGLGNNGNQPASGSIAPVDFDTSQREARLARMTIDTQTKMANADIADKQASVRLKDAQAEKETEIKTNQALQNRVFISTWNADMFNKMAQYNKIINDIKNDNVRTQFEKDLAEARKALAEFQSQPEYMQKLGSAEDAMSFIEGLLERLGQKLMDHSVQSGKTVSKHYENMSVTGSNF